MPPNSSNTEIWKDIPDFIGYQVSSFGRVRSFLPKRGRFSSHLVKFPNTPKILIPLLRGSNRKGKNFYYYFVTLAKYEKGKRIRVSQAIHRLVLTTFIGKPPSLDLTVCQTRHVNGNRLDNHVENLCWGSAEENAKDRIRHNTQIYGERVHFSKLCMSDVIKIRKLRISGIKVKEIAVKFNICDGSVYNIISKKTWNRL